MKNSIKMIAGLSLVMLVIVIVFIIVLVRHSHRIDDIEQIINAEFSQLKSDLSSLMTSHYTLNATVTQNTEENNTQAAEIARNSNDNETQSFLIRDSHEGIEDIRDTIESALADISNNADDIDTNAANISEIADDIDTNAASITNNADDIDTNAANISENAGDIDDNESAIADILAPTFTSANSVVLLPTHSYETTAIYTATFESSDIDDFAIHQSTLENLTATTIGTRYEVWSGSALTPGQFSIQLVASSSGVQSEPFNVDFTVSSIPAFDVDSITHQIIKNTESGHVIEFSQASDELSSSITYSVQTINTEYAGLYDITQPVTDSDMVTLTTTDTISSTDTDEYTFRLIATNEYGNQDVMDVYIEVTIVPMFDPDSTTLDIPDNTESGYVIELPQANNGIWTYSVDMESSTNDGLFDITQPTTESDPVTLTTTEIVNGGNNDFSFSLIATDNDGNQATLAVTVTVT